MNNLSPRSAMTARSLLLAALGLTGCQSVQHPPLAQVANVDLARFMGDWYVIANIPTFIEKDAYNAVESYRLAPDGSIATTFTFRAGGFDGKLKRYTPRGFVLDRTSNAVWGMQFIWPVKADYRIAWLAPDYSETVIARINGTMCGHGPHTADPGVRLPAPRAVRGGTGLRRVPHPQGATALGYPPGQSVRRPMADHRIAIASTRTPGKESPA